MKKFTWLIFVYALTFTITSCRKNPADSNSNPYYYNPDWTEISHGKADPDYQVVFPQDQVNRIDIYLGSDNWNAIRQNMQTLTGNDFGSMNNGAGLPEGMVPAYTEATIGFNQKKWKNVGFRLKGSGSLTGPWNKGIYKLPFRLNFDYWEDLYPGINDQRFFGFKELSFSAGWNDPSLIREKLAGDAYRNAGIPTPQTSFCRVFIDIGNGPEYWGLYCISELPEDNMILDQLTEESGNIYKPNSRLNIFNSTDFEKKNNFDQSNFSDINQLVTMINSPLRISNYNQWKQNIGNQFNQDQFAKYLSVSNAIVNRNGYGNDKGNYYLYHHSNNQFHLIPWDFGDSFSGNPGTVGTPGGGQNGLSLSMNEVTADWPLIRYLMDDPNFMLSYKNQLRTFLNQQLNSGQIDQRIDQYYQLITPYVTGPEGEQPGHTYLNNMIDFTNERNNLHTMIQNRIQLIRNFLP